MCYICYMWSCSNCLCLHGPTRSTRLSHKKTEIRKRYLLTLVLQVYWSLVTTLILTWPVSRLWSSGGSRPTPPSRWIPSSPSSAGTPRTAGHWAAKQLSLKQKKTLKKRYANQDKNKDFILLRGRLIWSSVFIRLFLFCFYSALRSVV